jgi:hypothetical protein
MEEVADTAENLDLSPSILDEIRRSYCRIRAWMIMSKSEIQLTLLKKQADALKAIVYTGDFRARFEKEYDGILELVNTEEQRTIDLANLIAVVNNYFVNYDVWTEDMIPEDETLEEYIQNLLTEEEKANQYIPTEAKYNNWLVYWLVYKHPKRNKEYAKRVYFSSNVKDFVIDGPGVFENKFGKKVYGVKITYYTKVRPTTIHRGNLEIHLPERWVKKYKVIQLPEGVEKVELLEERPEFAYPVA